MPDPREPRRPGDNAGNLLRDLRSLRDAAPRDVLRQAPTGQGAPPPLRPPVEAPKSSPARAVAFVLLAVGLIVAVAGYGTGAFDSKAVVMPVGPTPGPTLIAHPVDSSGAPAAPPSLASSPATTAATGTTAAARFERQLPPAVPGINSGQAGVQLLLARWLLTRYDATAPAALRFAQPTSPDAFAAGAGPAVWFGRSARELSDELTLVVRATTQPCSAPEAAHRVNVTNSLARLIAAPASRFEDALVGAIAGDPKPLSAVTSDPLATGLALGLAGEEPAAVDRALSAAAAANGWIPALRAHLAAMQDQRDDAIARLREVGAAAKSAGELFFAAGLATRLGQLELAAVLLERVKEVAAADRHAPFLRGLILELSGKPDAAKPLYDEAAECEDPRLIVAVRLRRALLLQKAKEFEKASRDLSLAEDFDGDAPGLIIARAREALTAAEAAKGSPRIEGFRRARRHFERMLVELGPTEESLGPILRCYAELTDQADTRQGLEFLALLKQHDRVPPTVKARVEETVTTLKDRLKPRAIYDEPAK